MKIGVIGLGQMGSPMAANLVASGHEVTVYNRTREKIAPLVELGAIAADDVAGACGGEVVLTMLADDSALEEVTFGAGGILESAAKGTVHISSSTIGIALAERLYEVHEAAGQRFVSAPVFGRPIMAERKLLFVVAAGAPDAIATCAPIFDDIGQRTFVFSENPSVANLVKLSGNFLIGSVIESLSEAMALVGKAGIERRTYLDFLTSTLFDAPVYHAYGGLVADRDFTPAKFPVPLGLKDVGLVLEAGEQLRVPLPLANLLRDRFLRLIAEGGDELDWSAISLLAAHDSGQE